MVEQQFAAELMRLQTVHLININLKPQNQIQDVRKLIKFPWENDIKEEIAGDIDWERLEKE